MPAVLMVMIDEATGWVTARFYEKESWASAADLFQRYVRGPGLPRGLYVDQHSIYRSDHEPTDGELLDDCPAETQFGRAMRELEVELILARSPQAKGRVERMNGTLQDRLVKALRRAGIADLDEANRFLEEEFLPELNARFGVPAGQPEDAHRPLSAGTDLARIVSIQESRVVAKDWTVRWSPILSPPLPKPPRRSGPTGSSQGQKPAANHPWRGQRTTAATASPITLTRQRRGGEQPRFAPRWALGPKRSRAFFRRSNTPSRNGTFLLKC